MNKKRADDTIPIRQPWETCKAARAAPYSSGYRPQCGLLGGHNGIGPNSALSIGVAIATYAQAKPTIRINILTARFMVFSLRCETPGRKPRGCGIIQGSRRPSSLFSSVALGAARDTRHPRSWIRLWRGVLK